MDEVKIWSIEDTAKVEELKAKGQMDTEWSFEDTLVSNPGLLIPDLTLVGRQTPMEGGPLDLLGVDGDGRLAVFELKRGTLSRDAVAQVIDYASDLDRMELGALAEHISERSGEHGIAKIEDFEEWYSQEFGEQGMEAMRPLRLFLVGLGADERTERMVTFLANNSGMDISLMTFHGFAYDGKTFLAKQVHVEGVTDSEPQPARRYVSVAEKRARLNRRIEESRRMSTVFGAVRDMFSKNWPRSSVSPGAYGLSVQLRRRSHARINVWKGGVGIRVFFPRSKALCLDEFREPVEQFRYDTWPKDLDPLEDANAEIHFKLTPEEWATHRERLYALTKAVYAAWESSGQDDGADSAQPVDAGA